MENWSRKSHKGLENSTQEAWRPYRTRSKSHKTRRQLFREKTFTSKNRNGTPFAQPSTAKHCRLESVDRSESNDTSNSNVDSNIDNEWKLILEYFHRELVCTTDTIGIECHDGLVEMVKNAKEFSQTIFHARNGVRKSLKTILADGKSQVLGIQYKLVPVVESLSVENLEGECTVYTRRQKSKGKASHACCSDEFDMLAETLELDESSSMGYASQSDATASTSTFMNGFAATSFEQEFIPIGSSTLGTDATETAPGDFCPNPDTSDMNCSLNDSQSSIYYDCEDTPPLDAAKAKDESHKIWNEHQMFPIYVDTPALMKYCKRSVDNDSHSVSRSPTDKCILRNLSASDYHRWNIKTETVSRATEKRLAIFENGILRICEFNSLREKDKAEPAEI